MGSYLKTLNRVRGESVRENVEGMVAGDLVRLKSGGPVMTVEGESGDGGIVCCWNTGITFQRENFRPELLKRYERVIRRWAS